MQQHILGTTKNNLLHFLHHYLRILCSTNPAMRKTRDNSKVFRVTIQTSCTMLHNKVRKIPFTIPLRNFRHGSLQPCRCCQTLQLPTSPTNLQAHLALLVYNTMHLRDLLTNNTNQVPQTARPFCNKVMLALWDLVECLNLLQKLWKKRNIRPKARGWRLHILHIRQP